MLKTLHARLVLVLLALLVPLGLLFILVTLQTAQRYFQEITQRSSASLARTLVEETPGLMIGEDVDAATFDALASSLAMTNPGVEVYILDASGGIIGASVPMEELRRKTVALEPVQTFLTGSSALPIRGADPRHSEGGKIFSAAALSPGYLYVVLADETRDSVIRAVEASTALRLGLWSGVTVLVLVFAVGVLAFALLTRRLRRLSSAMSSFRQHDFVLETPLELAPRAPRDDLDRLQDVFADMAARISEQVQALRRLDALRRELVTNVSHDLRTPLAALRGYLETLQMKDESLTPEERQRFLGAASRLSERLGRLIGDLFDLSKLEAGATPLQLEVFPFPELAQDVLLKVGGVAEERGVRLGLECADNLPFVRADLGLIERVLTNLVDNALRYTPKGGAVRVRCHLEGGGLRVEVADSGPGVAEADLPHIFERYYRSKGATEGGAGLGLAISQRILELHGESIEVKSPPGGGAIFAFWLPLAS